ncbi:porin [Aquamicrobium sp.]|uniref:porin n=1 Tax=Aquamicrobium sp. TaxID=1872579 RepID=UPI00258457CC|nr:porin [Aquamicrobium sp.]MCK9549196.1 porin [Aquamicrobium sp.]
MTLKTLTAASVAAMLMASPALAADMNGVGGNCCADLEERVAELEATAARKDNRKVSLTVYGQVNYGILSVDVDPPFEGAKGFSETTITGNSNSQSRFGFKGDATITPDWSAGFLMEIGVGETEPMFTEGVGPDGILGDGLVIRHSALYLKHNQLGTVWLGKTSSATDGIAEIAIANTAVASTLLSLEPVSGAWLGGINLPFDGGRTEVVKWVSPTVGGFTASAAWMGNDDEAWDAALRYAGELGGFQFAAGVGYRKETSPFSTWLNWKEMSDEVETITGSASVKHVASGLFVNAAAGKVDGMAGNGVLFSSWFFGDVPFHFVDPKALHVQAGVEQNFFGFGNTTLFGEWARAESRVVDSFWCPDPDEYSKGELDFWGLGVVQAIDAAAMDLYVSYRKYDLSEKSGSGDEIESSSTDASAIVAGAIIRF